MGASSSKEATPSWRPSMLLDATPSALPKLFTPSIRTTRCDSPAPPPLPPIGGSTPPPPPSTETTTQQKSSSSQSPPPPPSTADSDSIAAAASSVSEISNPGPYENASMDAKRLVTLDTHDGVRVDINKQLSPYMAAVHSFWLGTTMLPDGRNKTYTFLTQVADESGLLMARVDPERGSVDGRIHRALLGGLATAKIQIGVSSEGSNDQLLADLDFGGLSWTGNLKYGSMGGGIVFGCNYFQGITPSLALGGEGMYIAANQSLLANYMLKYTMPAKGSDDVEETSPSSSAMPAAGAGGAVGDRASSTMVANYNAGQGLLTLNYKRVVTPNRVTLGAELSCSPTSLESQVLVGAEFKLSRSKVGLCVDGTGRIQSILEAKLGMQPGSPSLNFSAEVDHGKDQMRFGYGVDFQG